MVNSLYTLKHEHRVIERALHALEGVCSRLEWGQAVPPEVLSQLVDFISVFADRFHHGKEETYLFPILEIQGVVRQGGPLAMIAQEHRIESELTAEMRGAVEGYREVDPEARQRFVSAARCYVNHLTGHIEREETILFRLASEMIDDKSTELLREGFACAQSEFGREASERYERLASALELEWAV
jgi:hemerythrin-like domain-containing protein